MRGDIDYGYRRIVGDAFGKKNTTFHTQTFFSGQRLPIIFIILPLTHKPCPSNYHPGAARPMMLKCWKK